MPRPRSTSSRRLSPCRSSGVSVAEASPTGANADTISDSGDDTTCSEPSAAASARQRVVIDNESLPTGIATPSAGQKSSATALTVSNSAASSPGWPQAAIQLADNFTCCSDGTSAAARLVIASPIAMRPLAGPSSTAIGLRSPIANASPCSVRKPSVVTATSATGTCHGPTS